MPMKQIKKLANAFYTNAEPVDDVSGRERYSIKRYKKKIVNNIIGVRDVEWGV